MRTAPVKARLSDSSLLRSITSWRSKTTARAICRPIWPRIATVDAELAIGIDSAHTSMAGSTIEALKPRMLVSLFEEVQYD